MNAALRCVSHSRLSLDRQVVLRDLAINTDYALAVRNAEPIALRGSIPMTLSIALRFRILENRGAQYPYTIATSKYFYALGTPESSEILAFHWSPDAIGLGNVAFPHLHVGRAVVSDASQILPRTFHKVHVPTGFVSMPSVIRLAITEFGVRFLRPNWQSVLDEAETATAQ